MRSLISINNKFMIISPVDLVKLVLQSTYTKGFEVCVDFNSEYEMNYLNNLVIEMKKNDLILQIHANVELPFEKQLQFLKKIEKYSDYLGYQIVVTFHSIYDENKEISINKTIKYFLNILNFVDNNKIVVCIENLNDVTGYDRLEKEFVVPIVLSDLNLYFTYDIGHEIMDNGKIIDLNRNSLEKIRNIHIHSNDGHGNDHFPIYKNDMYWNKVIKGIIYLLNNKYQYNIVYEYDLYACCGESIEDKIKDYLESIDFVSEHYC